MLRPALTLIAKAAVRTFYRRLDLAGGAKIPPRGPVLFVANHWNSLVDPLAIQCAVPRPVTFCAAEFLFQGALGPLMKGLGFIPIFRASDSHDPQQNRASFARAFEALAAGGAVGIFPEGVSHTEPHMQRIKSGAARIALGAEEEHGWQLGLQVIPLGLVWDRPETFRGACTVVVGDPIPVAEIRALAAEKPQRAARQLTQRIQEALEEVTFSQATWEDHRFLENATRLTLAALPEIAPGVEIPPGPEGEVAVHRRVRQVFQRLQAEDPERLAPLRREIEVYHRLLATLGITDRHVQEDYAPRRVLRYLARNLELFVLGWPFAAWGMVNNLLPHALVEFAAHRIFRPRRDRLSTYKIYPGVVIYALSWLAQTALVLALTWRNDLHWLWAVLYLISLPITGWYAISFLERRAEALRSARAAALFFGKRRLRAHLRRRRADLLERLRALREALERAGT